MEIARSFFSRRVLIGAGIVMAFAGAHFLFNRPSSVPGPLGEAPPLPVNVVQVHAGRFQDVIQLSGDIKGQAEIELRFEKEGKIKEFFGQEGSIIKKGQVIARLEDEEALLKVEAAEIELLEAERMNQIDPGMAIKLRKARLGLGLAQQELKKTVITAPRDGILGEKEAEAGEFVAPQRRISKLVSIDTVLVEMGVIEKNIDKIYPGQKVIFTVDPYPEQTFEGAVVSVAPLFDARTASVKAKAKNPQKLLLPGMYARAKIISYEADDVISIPVECFVRKQQGFQVFKINNDQRAELIDVQIGVVSKEYAEITGGLSAGDLIVTSPGAELAPNAKVVIIESAR